MSHYDNKHPHWGEWWIRTLIFMGMGFLIGQYVLGPLLLGRPHP